jgi:DNA polymerase-1
VVKGRLFLVDGTALAYRSYFAFINSPLVNSKGEDTSAAFGMTRALLNLIRDEKPEYLAIAFDAPGPTFRHEQYAEYKATREKMPDEMRAQLARINQIVEAMEIPSLWMTGYEADDVIGTLAHRAEASGLEAVVLSGDKDFCQIVSDAVTLLNPSRSGGFERIGVAEVRERFGVDPERVTDVLGLMGDTSDNVPGVPKIGQKTATALIQEYGSLEAALERAEDVSRKQARENLIAYADQARLSKVLVTIDTDAPVPVELPDLRFSGLDGSRLAPLFGELEFYQFMGEVGAPTDDEAPEVMIVSPSQLGEIGAELAGASEYAVDLETTSTDALRAEIVGVALAWDDEVRYIPVEHKDAENCPLEEVLETLKPSLTDPSIPKVGHNLKYDAHVLSQHGVEIVGAVFDTMVASFLIDAGRRQYSLSALALQHLGHQMTPISDLIGKGKDQKSFSEVPVADAATYSGDDARTTLRLSSLLRGEIEEAELEEVFERVEMPLVRVLMAMERAGVRVDIEMLRDMSAQFAYELEAIEAEIHQLAGERFNVNSTQQLGRILFEKLGLPPRRKTKTGYSTDSSVLEALAAGTDHPLPRRILDYRLRAKLKSTYLDKLPAEVNPRTGRIHASFRQTGSATGRLASDGPNLQNIPIRSEEGREIRKAFIPREPGYRLLAADYSQIELRIMAHLSGDSTLVSAFAEDRDVHTETAALLYGQALDAVDENLRRAAKIVNFGVMYGMGPYGLSTRLGMSIGEARAFIEQYFATYPGVKTWIDDTLERARQEGYVTTMLGRRRYLPEIGSSQRQRREFAQRTAINAPIQGTAADMIKLAMVAITERLRRERFRAEMILQVHDELVFDVPEGEVDAVRELVVEEMAGALELQVPVRVEAGIGQSWFEAH